MAGLVNKIWDSWLFRAAAIFLIIMSLIAIPFRVMAVIAK